MAARLTRSVSQGRTAGLVSAVGVNLGSAFHVLAAVAGLSLILANSAYAYTVVKWLGVAYLAWIGYRTLTAEDIEFAEPATQPQSEHTKNDPIESAKRFGDNMPVIAGPSPAFEASLLELEADIENVIKRVYAEREKARTGNVVKLDQNIKLKRKF